MKSNLTEQIDRMSFLMGLDSKIEKNFLKSKRILKESPSVFSWAKSAIGELIQTAKPIRGSSNYDIMGLTLDDNLFKTLRRMAEPTMSEAGIEAILSQLNISQKIALGNIFSKSESIVENVYGGIMKDLMNSPDGFDEYLFYQMIKEQMERGTDLDTVLKNVFGDDPLLIAVLRTRFQKNLELFKEKKFVPKYRTTDPRSGTKQLGLLTQKEVESINETINSVTPQVFIKDVATTWFKRVPEIQREIKELSNGFLKAIEGKSDINEINNITNQYSITVNRLINDLQIQMNGDAADQLDILGVAPEIVEKIKNSNENYFTYWRKIRSPQDEGFWTNCWEEFKKLGNAINSLRESPWNLIKPNQPWLSFLLTAQFDTWNRLYIRAIKQKGLSSNPKLARFWATSLVASATGYVLAVFGMGFFNTVLEGLKSGFNSTAELFGFDPVFDNEQWYKDSKNAIEAILVGTFSESIEYLKTRFSERGLSWETYMRVSDSTLPGGLGTIDRSVFSQIVGAVFGKPVPNVPQFIRQSILGRAGYDESEIDQYENQTESSESISDIPSDLEALLTDDQLVHIQKGENDTYTYEDEDGTTYPIKKSDNNKWYIMVEGRWEEIIRPNQ